MPIKVLQINAVYGSGSTGTIVRDLEGICEDAGIQCYIASPDINVKTSNKHYLIGNILDHKIHAFLTRLTGKQGYFSKKATKELLKYIDEVSPDIVHLHNLHSNFINLNILFKYLADNDIPTILSLHDCWFYTGGCFHYTAAGCMRWLNDCGSCPKRGCDNLSLVDSSASILADRKKYLLKIPRLYIVGVSEWISREASKTFLRSKTITSIRNGVDMKVFKPTVSDLRKTLDLEHKYVILGPGSKWLSPINSQIIKYFADNMREDEVLLLYGVSGYKGNLPQNIHLYGYTKNRNELAALYTMADVFANTTREDSLSLINVESQACGTPVVTFDATGPKETVDESYSVSVTTGDAKRLMDAVHLLRDNPKTDVTEMCRAFAISRFEMQSQYKKFVDLYRSIV